VHDAYIASTSTTSSSDHCRQLSIDSMIGVKAQEKYGSRHPDQIKITTSLVQNLIVDCGLPISIVENEGFHKFMDIVHAKYKLPYRSQVTSALLPKLREKKQDLLRELLSKARTVSLTMDIWTDRCMHSFLAKTVHSFVDLKLQTHLLAFHSFKGSHTGVRIADAVEHIIEEHQLKDKVIVCS
jgi:hypothetical protein